MIAFNELVGVCHGKLYLRADGLNDGFALLSFTDQVKERKVDAFPKSMSCNVVATWQALDRVLLSEIPR